MDGKNFGIINNNCKLVLLMSEMVLTDCNNIVVFTSYFIYSTDIFRYLFNKWWRLAKKLTTAVSLQMTPHCYTDHYLYWKQSYSKAYRCVDIFMIFTLKSLGKYCLVWLRLKISNLINKLEMCCWAQQTWRNCLKLSTDYFNKPDIVGLFLIRTRVKWTSCNKPANKL